MTLGNRMRLARQNKGLTQSDLAKIIGSTDATINRYERDLRKPDPETLKVIANALDIPVIDWLLGKDEIDLLEIFEDDKIKIVAGGRRITQKERISVLELIKENNQDAKKRVDLSDMVIAANAEGRQELKPISPELREILEDIVEEVLEEKERKRNKPK